MLTFIGVIQFIFAGLLTLATSRILSHFHASDDVIQLAYPSVAIFSLWLSSYIERNSAKKEIEKAKKTERDRWFSVIKEQRKSKRDAIGRVSSSLDEGKKEYPALIRASVRSAVKDALSSNDWQLEAKNVALSQRILELLDELDEANEKVKEITESRKSLEQNVSSFIRKLRDFHQEINRELKDDSSRNTQIWKSIDTLGDKIFERINEFDTFLSSSFINERVAVLSVNRKSKQHPEHEEFSPPTKKQGDTQHNKKSN